MSSLTSQPDPPTPPPDSSVPGANAPVQPTTPPPESPANAAQSTNNPEPAPAIPLPPEAAPTVITPADITGVEAELAAPTPPPIPIALIPQPKKKKATRPDLASRGLLLIWCFWLLGSWGVSMGIDSSLPAIRWMIFSAMLGMLLVWPMLRLSQEHPKSKDLPRNTIIGALESGTPMTPGAVFSDWLSLNLVFQLVVWPLRLSARWSIEQSGWLSLAMASWSLIIAALLIIGCKSDLGNRRTWTMFICILLFLAEPVILALLNTFQPSGHAFNWPLSVSPLEAIWVMSGPTSGWESRVWAPRIKIIALVALTMWLVVLIANRREQKKAT